MIRTKQDLEYYLSEDRRVYGKKKPSSLKDHIVNWLFPDRNYDFMVCLRHLEYHTNLVIANAVCEGWGKWHKIRTLYYNKMHARLRAMTGIELNPNCAGPGLHISHGKVVISSKAHLGRNCKVYSDVTIGGQGRYDRNGAPIIGDRVYIGTGARILGNIRIADDVVIGANAVVTKDILEPNTTWGGIPARKISDQGSAPYLRLPNDRK